MKHLLLIPALLFVLSCSTTDPVNPTPDPVVVKFKLDGQLVEHTVYASVMTKSTGASEIKTLGIGSNSIPLTDNMGVGASQVFANNANDCLPLGSYVQGSLTNLISTLTYEPTQGNILVAFESTVTITACDENGKRISGTFEGRLADGNDTISITEGEFIDIEFRVN